MKLSGWPARAAAAILTIISCLAVTAAPAAAGDGVGNVWHVVDADGGVYWRTSPDWNTARIWPGHGIYSGDEVYLDCYSWGGPGPSGNHLWYWAGNLSRNWGPSGAEYGWVNDHYLTTPGTAANPQPEALPCG